MTITIKLKNPRSASSDAKAMVETMNAILEAKRKELAFGACYKNREFEKSSKRLMERE